MSEPTVTVKVEEKLVRASVQPAAVVTVATVKEGPRGPKGEDGDAGGGTEGAVLIGGNDVETAMQIGTKNDFDLQVLVNNVVRAYFRKTGEIGIGSQPDDNQSFSIFKQGNGATTWTNFNSILRLGAPQGGASSAAQMAAYAVNQFDHDTGTYALGRNYFASEMRGNGTVTQLFGLRGISRLYDTNQPEGDVSSGIVEDMYGVEAYSNNTSTSGKVRRATGLLVSSARATGSDAGHDHTARGIWIQDGVEASGGDTNEAYAIDSESVAPSRFFGDLWMRAGKALRLFASSTAFSIALKAADGLGADETWELPAKSDGYLKCASGVFSFDTPSGGGSSINNLYNGSGNEVLVGTNNAAAIGSNPKAFGAYIFDTADSNRAMFGFDSYAAYYGNSSNSRNGTAYSFSLRPGETEFTYSGEFNGMVSTAFVSSPGKVSTLAAAKYQTATTNGQATIQFAFGQIISVIAPAGFIDNAYGIQVQAAEAKGDDWSDHLAVGIDIANGGNGVIASGNGSNNQAIGLRIGNNISGASKTRAIESLSTAPSTFAGDLEITDDEKGLILTSPNGTRYRLAVANDGTLSTSPA